MSHSHTRTAFLLVIVVAFAICAAVPALAYDKLYRFKNRTTVPQSNVQVILNGLEVTVGQYTDATYNPWGEGATSFQINGGTYDTSIAWGYDVAADIAPLERVRLGWNVSDGDCRLRSLAWVDAAGNLVPITDGSEYGSVPGGGRLLDGLIWEVINDTLGILQLTQVQVNSFTYDLGVGGDNELQVIATIGVTGQLMILLGEDITGLWADDAINDPTVNSLWRKLDNALEDNEVAYAAQDAGNTPAAITSWTRAARHVGTIIKELETGRKKKTVREDAYLILQPQAAEIQRLLAQLPGVDPVELQGGGTLPDALNPTESFLIDLNEYGAQTGDSVVLTGTVLGLDGTVQLNWVDQVILKPNLTAPVLSWTPENQPWFGADDELLITAADPELGATKIYYDVAYAATGLPDADRKLPGLANTPATGSVTLTFGASGNYVVTFLALDDVNNASEPQAVSVGVDLDPPYLAGVDPLFIWPPNHDMVPITITVADDVSGVASWEITGVEIDDLGAGDPDLDVAIGVDAEGNPTLSLRRERDGQDTARIYWVTVDAVDNAGNAATYTFPVTVDHDQEEA